MQRVDDSGGSISDCIRVATELLYDLAAIKHDDALRKELFNWFLKSSTDKKYQGWDTAWDLAKMAVLTASAIEAVAKGIRCLTSQSSRPASIHKPSTSPSQIRSPRD